MQVFKNIYLVNHLLKLTDIQYTRYNARMKVKDSKYLGIPALDTYLFMVKFHRDGGRSSSGLGRLTYGLDWGPAYGAFHHSFRYSFLQYYSISTVSQSRLTFGLDWGPAYGAYHHSQGGHVSDFFYLRVSTKIRIITHNEPNYALLRGVVITLTTLITALGILFYSISTVCRNATLLHQLANMGSCNLQKQ